MNAEFGKQYRIVDNIDEFHYFEIGDVVELVKEDEHGSEPRYYMRKAGSTFRQWVFTGDLEETK